MTRLIAAAVLLVALAAQTCVETTVGDVAGAGCNEGHAAYQRGDYATALREWRPLWCLDP